MTNNLLCFLAWGEVVPLKWILLPYFQKPEKNMKTKTLDLDRSDIGFGCLPVCSPDTTINVNIYWAMETKIAATIYAEGTSTAAAHIANQTSTAAAKLSPFTVARTADAMTAAVRTPIPTSSVETFNVHILASACWTNSTVDVLTGQRVIITASGMVNT
jgi:hypothetical protein